MPLNIPAMKREILDADGGKSPAKACDTFVRVFREGLAQKKFTPEEVSVRQLALALDVMDPFDESGSLRRSMTQAKSSLHYSQESLFHEANPTVMVNAFQVITGDLLGNATIEGYNITDGMIGEQLVTTVPIRVRGAKIPGVKTLGGALEVEEGHPYEETGFEEKYVTTKEYKNGRILSLTEELILQDQLGIVLFQARRLGETIRQTKEIYIVKSVTDALTSEGKYVYRPQGTAEALYATDGSNYNYIGSGNTTSTSYNAAVALEDRSDVETVLRYRWTEVVDDRVDGTAQPIAGLNSPANVILVHPNKYMTARNIVNGTEIREVTNTNTTSIHGNDVSGFVGGVLTSPYLTDANNWYYGNFKKQFIWSEFWPIQMFFQGPESESAFDADIAFRHKVRYWGGVSAIDSVFVTMIDGS